MANETPEEREKAKRKKLLLLLFLLLSTTEDELAGFAERVSGGDIQPATFGEGVDNVLRQAHAHAAYLGRTLAGNNAAFGHLDGAFGVASANEQKEFLNRFVQVIQSGKYTNEAGAANEAGAGTLSEAAITARVKLYAKALLGTANEAWALTLPDGTIFHWRVEEEANHCEDCPRIANDGPYTIETMPTYPGRGDTACITNCLCWLETTDGRQGFNLADFTD